MKKSLKTILLLLAIATSLFITAIIVTNIIFLLTNRGELPCGEDAWRWSLMYYYVGGPGILTSLIIGIIAFYILWYKKQIKIIKVLLSVVIIQLAISFMSLAIITWPNIIYTNNLTCE